MEIASNKTHAALTDRVILATRYLVLFGLLALMALIGPAEILIGHDTRNGPTWGIGLHFGSYVFGFNQPLSLLGWILMTFYLWWGCHEIWIHRHGTFLPK